RRIGEIPAGGSSGPPGGPAGPGSRSGWSPPGGYHGRVRVRVWIVDAPAVVAEARALLPGSESRRAERFAVPTARDLFIVSRALQRVLGGRLLGIDARRVAFDRRCAHCDHADHGKPRLAGLPSLDHSVSHGGKLGALAFTTRGRVGREVEAEDRRTDPATLIPVIASPGERDRLAGLSGQVRRRAFMRLWTRKEAVIKLT